VIKTVKRIYIYVSFLFNSSNSVEMPNLTEASAVAVCFHKTRHPAVMTGCYVGPFCRPVCVGFYLHRKRRRFTLRSADGRCLP